MINKRSTLLPIIQDASHKIPKPSEFFIGTFFYADLIQSDQDMLLVWNDNGGELSKVIDGIKFTINILFE